MIYSGLIYKTESESMFTLKIKNRLINFYLPRNTSKRFGKYLADGIYVSVEVGDEIMHKSSKCFFVKYFYEISSRKFDKIFYSIELFRNGIKDLLSNLNNTIFLDFEFNMQDFYPVPNFVSEIIEVGYCVCDSNLKVIEESHMLLKPTKCKKITKRAIRFLKYKQEQLNNRLPYLEFYNTFKRLVQTYDPHFIVWGRSDIEYLKHSFQLNNVPVINFKFIDLSQMHVNYYNLKNTPGLFKMAEEYNNIELPKQKHNALEDALMTKLVFSNFKETIK